MYVVNLFFEETLGKKAPQVGMYAFGDIPRAMLKEKYVFILHVSVLPDLEKDKFENFNISEVNENWYNKKNVIGEIRYKLYERYLKTFL